MLKLNGLQLLLVPAQLIPHWIQEWKMTVDETQLDIGMRLIIGKTRVRLKEFRDSLRFCLL
jgi:hypothetical protein